MKKIFILMLLLVQGLIFAAASPLPNNCVVKNFKFSGDNLLLNTDKVQTSQIFLLQNISTQAFFLNHSVANPSASAGWASMLDTKNWSALLLNNPQSFAINCQQMGNGVSKTLTCQKTLKVCQLQSAKIPSSMNGSFWLAENLSLTQLLQKIQQRGVSVQ